MEASAAYWKTASRDEQSRKEIHKPDILLAETGKKIEVKWGALHHQPDDYYYRTRGERPYWGWGFSMGAQFKKDKFDYCILLAARKNQAIPKHIFVLTLEEIKKGMKSRISGEAGKKTPSFFIETSDHPDFFRKRARKGKRKIRIEDNLRYREKHIKRWNLLKANGEL